MSDPPAQRVAPRAEDSAPDTTMVTGTAASQADEDLTAEARPVATILLHPDLRRIGERARMGELDLGIPLGISRAAPGYHHPTRGDALALGDPRVSRRPLWIQLDARGLRLWAEPGSRAIVEGEPLEGERWMDPAALEEGGIVVSLGPSVLLLLHRAVGRPPQVEAHGLLGLSDCMQDLRERIARLAGAGYPVLIRGASGTGKELVAEALHRLSPRGAGPLSTVNMAALPPTMAAAELFGYERGAFTGAERGRQGRFEQADGGSLFLDEIGAVPSELQPLLLRALESGEIQPLGRPARRVDVRVITATDAPLEAQIDAGTFSQALFFRLRATSIKVPPLRARREDIPLLLTHFLRDTLSTLGRVERLDPPAASGGLWLRAPFVAKLMGQPFPGNVRELKGIAAEIALHSHDLRVAALPPELVEEMARRGGGLPGGDGRPSPPSPPPGAPPPESPPGPDLPLSADAVREALAAHRYNISAAGRALGIARNTLLRRMDGIPDIVRPGDLDEETIAQALAAHGGDVAETALSLGISAHGLRHRLRELDIQG